MASDNPPPPPAPPDPTNYLYDQPMMLPTKALLNPVMVTITIRNGLKGNYSNFVLPRALICEKSAYFNRAFLRGFAEEGAREIELPDVEPWIFEVFVGWLYTGKVYWHEGESESSGKQRQQSESKKRQREEDDEPDGPLRRVAPRIDSSDYNATQSPTRPMPAMPAFSGLSKTDSKDHSDQRPFPGLDRVSDNVTLWPYESLFKLYHFADLYDTRGFRMQILNWIQLKLLQLGHHEPPGLTAASTTFALSRLLPTSPLYKVLRDYWSKGVLPISQRAHVSPAGLVQLPHDFLAECLATSNAHAEARRCHNGEDCTRSCHDSGNAFSFYRMWPCYYHEHPEGRSNEKSMCFGMWELLTEKFCEPPRDEVDRHDEGSDSGSQG